MSNSPFSTLITTPMKKKQLTRKLSLNKQTLSVLDAQAMQAIKGGLAIAITSPSCYPTCTDANTYNNCC